MLNLAPNLKTCDALPIRQVLTSDKILQPIQTAIRQKFPNFPQICKFSPNLDRILLMR
ncbi:hypothetical protein CAMRE0001_1992 [Campylobacter rectus RM3267]|uniref:Uncharacterized protein n=1 Tax=Campylobacter rectus RM3267 TaxID=553218 RepID=B9D3B6_CAMRE|nr:hypothetical protein CAMRE0001_1992 [Campylobacter rectus RM3267]